MKKIGNFWNLALAVIAVAASAPAQALDLDWSGDFRAENFWISNYRLSDSNAQAGGYSIPGSTTPAQFQPLFMRLKPRVIVNDNVYLRSELWFGTPGNSFFGDAAITNRTDANRYYTTQSFGGILTAQRYWAEILTDVGNLQVGRAPLNWGLGMVWSAGDGLWDRFQSTGDVVQLVSKFGAFSFIPASVKYSTGNSLVGGSTFSDYALALKYENADDDFEGGVNFIRRVGGANAGFVDLAGNPGSINQSTWDVFTRKKFGKFQFAAEAPIVSGKINEVSVSTYALAVEGKYALNDAWNFATKLGHVPGQGGDLSKVRGFFVHPNYKLGLILFNMQLAGLSNGSVGSAATRSAFDSPLFNANYLQVSGDYTLNKWQFRGAWTLAQALEVAGAGSVSFYNQQSRAFETSTGAPNAQSSSYGWELDGGALYRWDDHLDFKADAGIFLPGDFYKYSGGATENQTGTVLALVLGVGARF